MGVRAKFVCDKVELNKDSATVRMTPVVSGSEENKQFYKWTPSGSIVLDTINKDAVKQFEPGKSYFVDFAPAD